MTLWTKKYIHGTTLRILKKSICSHSMFNDKLNKVICNKNEYKFFCFIGCRMKALLTVIISVLCVVFVFFSETSMAGAAGGFELFMSSVFPALFPFFVCVSALRHIGVFTAHGGWSTAALFRIFIISCISGSPSGSLLLHTSRQGDDPASIRTVTVLSAFSNLSSPVFIIGTVCGRMLNASWLIPLLMLSHYGSAFILFSCCVMNGRMRLGYEKKPAIALESTVKQHRVPGCNPCRRGRNAKAEPKRKISGRTAQSTHLAAALPHAIRDSVQTMLQIGGTLIFFMVIISVVDSTGITSGLNVTAKGTIFGAIEMTNGISLIASAECGMRLRVMLISAVLSFGGICVLFQAMGVAEIQPRTYISSKLLHGLLSALICFALYPIFSRHAEPANSTLGGNLVAERVISMMQMAVCAALASALAALIAVFTARRTRA